MKMVTKSNMYATELNKLVFKSVLVFSLFSLFLFYGGRSASAGDTYGPGQFVNICGAGTTGLWADRAGHPCSGCNQNDGCYAPPGGYVEVHVCEDGPHTIDCNVGGAPKVGAASFSQYLSDPCKMVQLDVKNSSGGLLDYIVWKGNNFNNCTPQDTTKTIGGKILSSTNIPVSGVNVTLVNQNNGASLNQSTDGNGDFIFNEAIPHGHSYTVRITQYESNGTLPVGYNPPPKTTTPTTPTPINSAKYVDQVAQSSSATDCSQGLNCNFRFDVVPVVGFRTIGGQVRNAATGNGVPFARMWVCKGVGFYPADSSKCRWYNTDAVGDFRSNDFITTNDSIYSVYPPTAIPAGYVAPFKSSTLNWTWNTAAGKDTPLGSPSYESQQYGNNDCASPSGGSSSTHPAGTANRCSFTIDPAQNLCPTNLTVQQQCLNNTGTGTGTRLFLTFKWNEAPNAATSVGSYNLKVNNLTNPNNASTGLPYGYTFARSWDSTRQHGCLPDGTCSARFPQVFSNGALMIPFAPQSGHNYNWNVIVNGTDNHPSASCNNGAGVNAPQFTATTCATNYTISGQLYEVNASGASCVAVGSPSEFADKAGLSGVEVAYTPNSTTPPPAAPVNTNTATFTIPEANGLGGTLYINHNDVLPKDLLLMSLGIRYRLACYANPLQASGAWQKNPIANVTLPSFTSNLSNFRWGYEYYNPHKDGWMTVVDGDAYSNEVVSTVPDVSTVKFGQDYAYVAHNLADANIKFPTLFGNDLTGVSTNNAAKRSQPTKSPSLPSSTPDGNWVADLTNKMWDDSWSFTPPSYAIAIPPADVVDTLYGPTTPTCAASAKKLEVGKVYKISAAGLNNFLSNRSSYRLCPNSETNLPLGVAVVYVEGNNAINFTRADGLVSRSYNGAVPSGTVGQRIIFVATANVNISSGIGTSADILAAVPNVFNTIYHAMNNATRPEAPALPGYGALSNAHIEAPIITSGTITFESVCSTPGCTNKDKILIMEGPLVAGDGPGTGNSSILVKRNLHEYNALLPTVIVKKSLLVDNVGAFSTNFLTSYTEWVADRAISL